MRQRVFHGWWIVLVGFGHGCVSVFIATYLLSLTLTPISGSLATSRSSLVAVLLVRTFVHMLVSPVIGSLADTRSGPRALLAVGGTIVGISAIAVSSAQSLWQFYLFSVLGFIGSTASSDLVMGTVISRWFVRQRGRAVAFYGMGHSGGALFLLPLATLMMDAFDWRAAWRVTGGLMLLLAPLSWLVVHRAPQDIGLLPDGDTREPEQRFAPQAPLTDESWSARDALRTPALWLFVAASSIGLVSLQGLLINMGSYAQDRGFSIGGASTFLFVFAAAVTVAKPCWGLWAERRSPRSLMIAVFLGTAVGIALITLAEGNAAFYAGAVLWGIFSGAFQPLITLIWASYFGTREMGRIRGVTQPISSIVIAAAPLLVASLRDARGDYLLAFALMACAQLVAAGFMLLAKPPGAPTRGR